MWAVPEGTPIFPGEPIITVKGPAVQAMMIETMVLVTINHQSLIATKANRIVRAAAGRAVMEFGSMQLANDLFNGKVSAMAKIGEGTITMNGMINMLDNMNRILDRVGLYLA